MSRNSTFTFRGAEIEYFDHRYNHASQNMRSIEIPIAMRYVRNFNPRRVVEVGNVLRHYIPKCPWVCVDSQERAKGVHNSDVMTWEPPKRFNLLVSISTVEHISHGKYAHITPVHYSPIEIFEKLTGLLTEKGTLVVTIPLNYNQELDCAIKEGEIPNIEMRFMRRINNANEWEETDMETAYSMPYGKWRWGAAMAVITAGRDAWL